MNTSLIERLRQRLGPKGVVLSEDVGERYHADWSGVDPCSPVAVVLPRDTDEVAFVMRSCEAAGQKVVVQGGMTGLCAGSTPRPGELALSLERLTGIEDVDPAAMTMTVLAGTPLELIQRRAADAGLKFPLDLGARGSCTIGGNIATNAGGTEVIRYGTARSLILGLEAVLPDGTVLTSMNKMLKNNAGFDLKHLFIGSEGVLGIVTRAVLRLVPAPLGDSTFTALCASRTLEDVIELLAELRRGLGDNLTAFEVMWPDYISYIARHVDDVRAPFAAPHPIHALIEYADSRPGAEGDVFEATLADAIETGLLSDVVVAQSAREARNFWHMRDAIGEVIPRLCKAVNFDVSAPLASLPQMLESIWNDLRATFEEVTILTYGHLGDGNVHLTVATSTGSEQKRISDIVYRHTGEHQGSISGEHGIGVMKREYLVLSRSEPEIELMRKLKKLVDPKAILNADRVIPS